MINDLLVKIRKFSCWFIKRWRLFIKM